MTIKLRIPYPDALIYPATLICALLPGKTDLFFFFLIFFVKAYGTDDHVVTQIHPDYIFDWVFPLNCSLLESFLIN